uniref:Sodium/hydrogen exchanger 7 n=1 Tax=Aegilops tauschii TaxID=37682 RepID=M8BQ08_AEGTA
MEGVNMISLKTLQQIFLSGVQAAYRGMLEEGRITQSTTNILMRFVDEAKDLVSSQPLCNWKVLGALMTRQVTYAVLTHLSKYIQDLRKTGLLEEEEMVHLDDALQTDLKKLKRNPPMVKMPRVSELLSSHPLVGALPSAVRGPLLSNAKETTNPLQGRLKADWYMACFGWNSKVEKSETKQKAFIRSNFATWKHFGSIRGIDQKAIYL